jgi:hypothetical protein
MQYYDSYIEDISKLRVGPPAPIKINRIGFQNYDSGFDSDPTSPIYAKNLMHHF